MEVIYISDSSSSVSSRSHSSDEQDDVLIGQPVISKIKPGICRLCGKNSLDVMFHPCNHSTCCFECYEKLPKPKKCPYCGVVITLPERFILG